MTALQRAREYLNQLISKTATDGTGGLPTLQELAIRAGVSRMTMWHALKEYRNAGMITAGRGKRIVAGRAAALEGASVFAPPLRRTLVWKRLTDKLEQEIRNGIFMPDQRPSSIKEMTARHGVCYRTMRNALDDLERRGAVERTGNRYRPSIGARTGAGRSCIVLVTAGQNGVPAMVTPRTQDHVRIMEEACARLALRMLVFTVDQVEQGEQALRHRLRSLLPIGFILWVTGMAGGRFTACMTTAASFGLPLAVLDENGNAGDIIPPVKAPLTLFKMAVSPLCGKDMGRYLLELGHRRMAFISMDHTSGYGHSFWRLEGLHAAFDEKGVKRAVTPFLMATIEGVSTLVSQIHQIETSISQFTSSTEILSERTGGELRGIAGALSRRMQKVRLGELNGSAHLHTLLEDALRHEDLTAWVCDSDPTALECLDFLAQRRIKVPQRISVVGFDDSMSALIHNLTTYNFESAGVMRAMLWAVVKPGKVKCDGAIELPGRVVERSSCTAPQS